jgi:hypothetical protein
MVGVRKSTGCDVCRQRKKKVRNPVLMFGLRGYLSNTSFKVRTRATGMQGVYLKRVEVPRIRPILVLRE